MKIYLGLDHKCVSPDKIASGTLGGTERKFFILADHLREEGHEVHHDPDPGEGRYDLAIHANANYPGVWADKHIVWAGSWHTDAKTWGYDVVVLNTEFMKATLGLEDAHVIHAPYQSFIPDYRTEEVIQGRIFCHSNPNRYFPHALAICEALVSEGVTFRWHYSGGNKLYSHMFPECFNPRAHPRMIYWGPLPRIALLRALSQSQVWVYPNLDDNSETQCVAAIEAAVLGLPVIVPDREPFREVMGSRAFYAKDVSEFVGLIVELLKNKGKTFSDMEPYCESIVMQQWLELIEETCSPEEISGDVEQNL